MQPDDDDEYLATTFMNTLGHNNAFIKSYLMNRVASVLMAMLEMVILCIFFGDKYFAYGFDFILYRFLSGSSNPMHNILPSVVTCKWSAFDMNGMPKDIFKQCLLPANKINKWILLTQWYWIVFVAILNVFSFIGLYISLFMQRKKAPYRKLSIGDRFLMNVIRLNISEQKFVLFCTNITDKLETCDDTQ